MSDSHYFGGHERDVKAILNVSFVHSIHRWMEEEEMVYVQLSDVGGQGESVRCS